MKIKCMFEYPNEKQMLDLGEGFYRAQKFGVTAGMLYLVLGLSFYPESSFSGKGLIFQIEADSGEPSWAPACLFAIIDPRVSRYWSLKMETDGSVHLWPPSFYRDFYHEDLSEGVSAIVDDYKKMLSILKAEAGVDIIEDGKPM